MADEGTINGLSEHDALFAVYRDMKMLKPKVESLDRERWLLRGGLTVIGFLQALDVLQVGIVSPDTMQQHMVGLLLQFVGVIA